MKRDGVAWVAVAIVLGAVALAGSSASWTSLDWEPALAWAQPWRAWTAVGVHYSAMHLAYNLGGLLLTALLGWAARAPARIAWAWVVAWPLTQFGLLLKPSLLHYGGLSGVLHAGVAAIVTCLLVTGTRAQRVLAGIVAAGLVIKLLGESPWGEALRYPPAWDIAVAPIAHATGVAAGAGCALVALLWPARRMRGDPAPIHRI